MFDLARVCISEKGSVIMVRKEEKPEKTTTHIMFFSERSAEVGVMTAQIQLMKIRPDTSKRGEEKFRKRREPAGERCEC